MPKMKKGKIIVMSPQHQNYFILLIDEVGGGGGGGGGGGDGGGRPLVVSKAELQPLRRSPFQLKRHLISCMQGSVCLC